MNLQELEQLYLKRQSCREFSDMVVPDELVTEICRVALLAPSAMNAQPWRLVAVTGEKVQEIAKAMQGMGMNKFVSKASAIVVLVAGKESFLAKAGSLIHENEFVKNDLGILTAHLVLAAEAAGVGSCILGWRDEEKLRTLLGLKKTDKIPEVVALGYPAEGYAVREKNRKPLKDVFALIK